jgi:hypothetical protein
MATDDGPVREEHVRASLALIVLGVVASVLLIVALIGAGAAPSDEPSPGVPAEQPARLTGTLPSVR